MWDWNNNVVQRMKIYKLENKLFNAMVKGEVACDYSQPLAHVQERAVRLPLCDIDYACSV
jgi:hypothetical protein